MTEVGLQTTVGTKCRARPPADQLTQPTLDRCYGGLTTANRQSLRGFLNWAITTKRMLRLQFTGPRFRIGEALDIIRTDGGVVLRLGDPPSPVPELSADLLLHLVDQRTRAGADRWLFSGHSIGQPMSDRGLARRLRALGIVALLVSVIAVRRQIQLSRHSNSIPMLIDLFREHRGDYLAKVRHLVVHELSASDLSAGLTALPEGQRQQVRDLIWFYDNLGAFVVHKIIDAPLVAGYMGGSIIDVWEKLLPLVLADRVKRAAAGRTDHKHWLEYFQYLYDAAVAAEAGREEEYNRKRAVMRRIRHG